MDIVWYKCLLCGYEWEKGEVDITYYGWYDGEDDRIIRCFDCINAEKERQIPKENINDGFK